MNITEDKQLRDFEEQALQAFCKQSESEGFIFTPYQGRSSEDESAGYCIGFQNGYKQALIDNELNKSELI